MEYNYLIGMSVPPLMIAKIADEVYKQWLLKLNYRLNKKDPQTVLMVCLWGHLTPSTHGWRDVQNYIKKSG